MLFIFLLGVGSCTVFLAVVAVNVAPTVQMATEDVKIQDHLGSKGTVIPPVDINGHRTWTIMLSTGYESQAKQIACNVVKADLKGTQFENDDIQVEDLSGNVLATGSGC